MAIAFKAKGTFASGTGNITPGLPAGLAAGDMMLMMVENANQAASPPTNWLAAPTPSGTPSRGTAGAAGGVALNLFYRFWQSGDAAPTVTDTGDHTTATILAYSGVDPTTPFDVTPVGYNTASSTSFTGLGITTVTPNCMVIYCIAVDIDNTSAGNAGGAGGGSGLATLTEREDNSSNVGQGGGVIAYDGIKTTAGAAGSLTLVTTSTATAGITVALRPLVAKPSFSAQLVA